MLLLLCSRRNVTVAKREGNIDRIYRHYRLDRRAYRKNRSDPGLDYYCTREEVSMTSQRIPDHGILFARKKASCLLLTSIDGRS